jgi:hypothetical protein
VTVNPTRCVHQCGEKNQSELLSFRAQLFCICIVRTHSVVVDFVSVSVHLFAVSPDGAYAMLNMPVHYITVHDQGSEAHGAVVKQSRHADML